jgi:shikimate 5-dehydrogenase
VRVRHAATAPGCLFVDLVYGAHPTAFLAAAARAGRPTLDGAGMLLHQGALAWEAWTDRPAPLAAMARALTGAGLTLTRLGGTATVGSPRPVHA